MILRNVSEKIFAGEQLGLEDGIGVMSVIANGEFVSSQLAALLGMLRVPGILTPDFIRGVRQVALERAIQVQLEAETFIDVCGTGGDGKDTFNISTGSAFVIAACGVKVVKHGNYAVSSKCGSSNVLEALGYKFPETSDAARREFEKSGLTFLHAPFFHPAFKAVGALRKEIAFKTFFNLLGPLVNPALPTHQLIGVSTYSLQRFIKQVLEKGPLEFALVHSLDGYDEISLTGNFKIMGSHHEELVDPRDWGCANLLTAKDLAGGESAADNAKILTAVFSGEGTLAQIETLSFNAAAGLRLMIPGLSWPEALERSRQAIVSGGALTVLKNLLQNNR